MTVSLVDRWADPDAELRNIEVIVQERSGIEGIDTAEREVLAKVQEILYSTSVSCLSGL